MTFTLTLLILVTLTFLAMSAFFSGSETALMKLSKIKIKHWMHSKPASREAWANWLSHPQELISAILVGNTLVNVFISSLTAMIATRLFHTFRDEWVQTFAGGIAFLAVVMFGEVVPKILGRRNPERISSFALGPLYSFSRFLGTPLKKMLDLLSRLFPILKQPTPSRVSSLTLDEIRTILLDSTSLVGLGKDAQEMMKRVLDSRKTTVSQIMTPWKSVNFLVMENALAGGSKMERFIDDWVESGRTRVLVVKGHPPQLIGYLYVKDILSCVAQNQIIQPALCQRWLRPIPFISPEMRVQEVLDLFRFGSPIACVQDRSGFPLGVVTLEDVLEEFVGEILDEYDIEAVKKS